MNTLLIIPISFPPFIPFAQVCVSARPTRSFHHHHSSFPVSIHLIMLSASLLLVLAALPTALSNYIPTQNWGVSSASLINSASKVQKAACSRPGDFFIAYNDKVYCVAPESDQWESSLNKRCPLGSWGWHKTANW
jgi:hypothetical protein